MHYKALVRVRVAAAVLAIAACKSSPNKEPEAKPSAVELLAIDGKGLVAALPGFGTPVVVVNVWATWCAPCVEEFPVLVEFHRAHTSEARVVFVSADFESESAAAQRFLEARGAPTPSYIKHDKDQAFIDALAPTWSGALPVTVFFDRNGRRLAVLEGAVDRPKLEAALAAAQKEMTP